MSIRPVSSVSYNSSYNNISFEGKKHKSSNGHSVARHTGLLKSIPLAAIIAMSPMAIQAQGSIAPQEKVVASGEYKGAFLSEFDDRNSAYRTCGIYFLSTDHDDSDVEVVRLEFAIPRSEYRTVNGKRQRCNYTQVKYLDVSELEKCAEIKSYSNGLSRRINLFYVKGHGEWYVNEYKAEDGTVTKEGTFRKSMYSKIRISEDLYKYLSETLQNTISYTNTSIQINGNDEILFQ